MEVLGVLENVGPQTIHHSGEAERRTAAETGVLEGMSGSPVYIDGKLVGAVALGFTASQGGHSGHPAD